VREGWPFYRGLVGAAFKGHTNAHLWADQPVSAPGIVYEGPLAYTAMGHPTGVWSERKFLRHIVGGIRMAAGYTRFDC
jgi:hypothetical protein